MTEQGPHMLGGKPSPLMTEAREYETPRRKAAVEKLIQMGFVWTGEEWVEKRPHPLNANSHTNDLVMVDFHGKIIK